MLGVWGSGKVGQGKCASCWGMEGLEGVIAEKNGRARETNSGACHFAKGEFNAQEVKLHA